MQLLAISGSLRAESTNTALLRSLGDFVADGTNVLVYEELGKLPIFNPDSEGDSTPPVVTRLAKLIEQSDGLVISSPEYAHGIPGGLKNAFDWLTSRFEIIDKPILLIHASHRGDIALAALREVLNTLSSNTSPEMSIRIPLIGRSAAEVKQIVGNPEASRLMAAGLREFVSFIETREAS